MTIVLRTGRFPSEVEDHCTADEVNEIVAAIYEEMGVQHLG